MLTSAMVAVIGTLEVVLIAAAVIMVLVVPVAVLVGLWLWQRGKRAPPVKDNGPLTTWIDF